MNTENLATNYVRDLVDKCPGLESFINDQDRTPFTDGHIDLYSAPKHTKDTFGGRIQVQVKGRAQDPKQMSHSRHAVRVSDLRAFLDQSGVLYFVVNINKRTLERRGFYAALSPFRIDGLLAQVEPGQQTVTIDLKGLPEDAAALQGLVAVAIKAKRQNPCQGFDPSILEKATEVSLHGWEPLDWEHPITLDPAAHDFTAFVKTPTGLNVALPGVLEVVPGSYLGEPVEAPISSGGITYANPIRRRISRERDQIELSKTLRLVLEKGEDGSIGRIEFELSDDLAQRIKDISFFLACVDTRQLSIDGHPMGFDAVPKEDPEDVRRHLDFLFKLQELLEYLGARTDLPLLPIIDQKLASQLKSLHQEFIEGISTGSPETETQRIYLPIGKWGLEVMTLREHDGVRTIDLFAPGFPFPLARTAEGPGNETQRYLATPYELLDAAQLSRTLNLHLDSIVDAYRGLPETRFRLALANETVLRLISAADLEPLRKDEFLEAATRLNQWLLDLEGRLPHSVVNQLQVVGRQRSLTRAERDELHALKRQAIRGEIRFPLETELSCAILLKDHEGAEEALKRFSDEKLSRFKTWPIWGLHDSLAKDPEVSRPTALLIEASDCEA